VYLADVDVPFSHQIQMDAVDFVRALSRVMQDKPVHENSNQSGDMTTAASRFLAYGDFQQFVIVDRVGSTLGPGDPERGAGHSEELTGESNLIVVVVVKAQPPRSPTPAEQARGPSTILGDGKRSRTGP
jgi:hypothetical protein